MKYAVGKCDRGASMEAPFQDGNRASEDPHFYTRDTKTSDIDPRAHHPNEKIKVFMHLI